MAERKIGVIMNGVTGRMGTNQHLIRSILAIRAQGGVPLANGDRIVPEPILVGRNPDIDQARRDYFAAPTPSKLALDALAKWRGILEMALATV